MEFNQRLKQLRVDRSLNQIDLAEFLNLKPTTISNYESGRNEPTYDKLKMLAEYFNVTVDYLLGVTDDTFPISGEVVNKETYEFYLLYNQLNKESKGELKDYAKWLHYKQINKQINK